MSGCEEEGDGEGEGVVSFYQDAKMRQASGYHVTGTRGALCRVSEPGGGLLIKLQSNFNCLICMLLKVFQAIKINDDLLENSAVLLKPAGACDDQSVMGSAV